MISNILIGNIISCVAAVFTVMSSLSSGKRKIYRYCTLQCLTMAVGSIFFASYSGITTFILCAVRNYLLSTDHYSRKIYLFFLITGPGIGLICNNRGWIGLLPVVATLLYTIGQYYFQSDLLIKANTAVNLFLWTIYDIAIHDYVSTTVDSITVIITIAAVIILCRAGY